MADLMTAGEFMRYVMSISKVVTNRFYQYPDREYNFALCGLHWEFSCDRHISWEEAKKLLTLDNLTFFVDGLEDEAIKYANFSLYAKDEHNNMYVFDNLGVYIWDNEIVSAFESRGLDQIISECDNNGEWHPPKSEDGNLQDALQIEVHHNGVAVTKDGITVNYSHADIDRMSHANAPIDEFMAEQTRKLNDPMLPMVNQYVDLIESVTDFDCEVMWDADYGGHFVMVGTGYNVYIGICPSQPNYRIIDVNSNDLRLVNGCSLLDYLGHCDGNGLNGACFETDFSSKIFIVRSGLKCSFEKYSLGKGVDNSDGTFVFEMNIGTVEALLEELASKHEDPKTERKKLESLILNY